MESTPEGFDSFRIEVPQEFKSVFSHFYFAKNTSGQILNKTLLPSFQTILLFCFGQNASLLTTENTKIEIDKCLVLGPVKQAFSYTLPKQTSILVANFKDDAFYRFFGKNILPKFYALNPDDLLFESCFTHLWHELRDIKSPSEQVHYILNFCKPYLKSQDAASALLSNFADENLNPIKVISQELNQSERNIQIKQKEQFGYSSKELNRYQRFLKAVQLIENKLENAEKIVWFDVVSECQYYDQSQLIHDFKHFLKLSPTEYLKFQEDICNPKAS